MPHVSNRVSPTWGCGCALLRVARRMPDCGGVKSPCCAADAGDAHCAHSMSALHSLATHYRTGAARCARQARHGGEQFLLAEEQSFHLVDQDFVVRQHRVDLGGEPPRAADSGTEQRHCSTGVDVLRFQRVWRVSAAARRAVRRAAARLGRARTVSAATTHAPPRRRVRSGKHVVSVAGGARAASARPTRASARAQGTRTRTAGAAASGMAHRRQLPACSSSARVSAPRAAGSLTRRRARARPPPRSRGHIVCSKAPAGGARLSSSFFAAHNQKLALAPAAARASGGARKRRRARGSADQTQRAGAMQRRRQRGARSFAGCAVTSRRQKETVEALSQQVAASSRQR